VSDPSGLRLHDPLDPIMIQVDLEGRAILMRRLSDGSEEPAENWEALKAECLAYVKNIAGTPQHGVKYRCPQDIKLKARWSSPTPSLA
jgi:hypothetical protein